MIVLVSLVIFYFVTPVVILYLCHRYKWLNKIGMVVIAYCVGIILGNSGIFPRNSPSIPSMNGVKPDTLDFSYDKSQLADQIVEMQDILISAVILLAIPLMLFSLDLKKWLGLAKRSILSMTLALGSLLAAIFAGFHLFAKHLDEPAKICGMLVGLYTGGTPNLAAISTALDVDPNTFLLTHTYDMAIGALFLLFLMTVAQRLFNLFLPRFHTKGRSLSDNIEAGMSEDADTFVNMLSKYGLIQLLKGFSFSSGIVAAGGVIGILVPDNYRMLSVILTITTLDLLFSTWKVVNSIENTFQLGMYFIIVFSLVVASMGDLSQLFKAQYIHLFGMVAVVVIGSGLMHLFLSFLFRIDSDTTIITMTALSLSPPFVPVVACALRNKNVIISGLTIGLLGYAIGNYLGLVIAYFLQ